MKLVLAGTGNGLVPQPDMRTMKASALMSISTARAGKCSNAGIKTAKA